MALHINLLNLYKNNIKIQILAQISIIFISMNQGINFYKTWDVKKISQCHESNGSKTLTPNSRLDRWGAINTAISSWLINDADDDIAVLIAPHLSRRELGVSVLEPLDS